MKMFAQWLGSAVVAVVLILSNAARPAWADSYTVVNLGDSDGHGIYGIDSAGDVVVWGTSGCGMPASYCYVTYVNGVATSDSSVAPVLAFDNGSACGSPIAGFNTSKTVCNGGWTGLGSFYNSNGDPNGIYYGQGSDLTFIQGGAAGQVFLNSSGDFAWTNGMTDEMYELIDTSLPQFATFDVVSAKDAPPATTPEPGALLLVGTGLLGITLVLRRKFTRFQDLSE
jgi:hypothetical protein